MAKLLKKKESHQSECSKDCNAPCEVHADPVSKALSDRKQKLSKGGVVANEQGPGVDGLENEFDYLALSGGLEDNSGPGNEIGDGSLLQDMVSRVMLSRKKQHNPSPA